MPALLAHNLKVFGSNPNSATKFKALDFQGFFYCLIIIRIELKSYGATLGLPKSLFIIKNNSRKNYNTYIYH